jgi:trehalose dimycolate hydrolase
MSGVNRFRMFARSAAVASALGCVATLFAAAPPATAAGPCSDVEVVFARGTGEPGGVGTIGQSFIDALRPQLGGRVLTSYGVNYPADYDFLNAATGADDAETHIQTLVSQCPNTKIVLGGFSQGAAVVDMLASIPPLGNKIGGLQDRFHDIGEGAPLSPDLVPHIAAVAVFGNPSTKFSIPVTNSVFGDRAIDLCKDGDPICSRGRNPFAHSDYATSGMTAQAANFVAGLLPYTPAAAPVAATDAAPVEPSGDGG